MGVEVFQTLKKALHDAGHNTNVGDEGGFAPNLKSADEALAFVMKAIEAAGYKPGEEVALALDPASTEFFKNGKYVYEGEGKTRSIEEQAKYLAELVGRYPIVSIEDGMAEDDFDGWKRVTDLIGGKCQLVGDDLFVTNVDAALRRHQARARQLDPGQGQPDRHAHRDARRGRDGAQGRLHGGDVASLGRDRGFDHRRPRGRDQLRADQDRLARALRPHRQVQSAAAHRAGAGRAGEVCRQGGAEGAALGQGKRRWIMPTRRGCRDARPDPIALLGMPSAQAQASLEAPVAGTARASSVHAAAMRNRRTG